jgi:hypothetical protein
MKFQPSPAEFAARQGASLANFVGLAAAFTHITPLLTPPCGQQRCRDNTKDIAEVCASAPTADGTIPLARPEEPKTEQDQLHRPGDAAAGRDSRLDRSWHMDPQRGLPPADGHQVHAQDVLFEARESAPGRGPEEPGVSCQTDLCLPVGCAFRSCELIMCMGSSQRPASKRSGST